MSEMITKIALQNYCGFDFFDIDLKRINIFVGRNNTGKTTILRAIELFKFFLNKDQRLNYNVIYKELKNSFYKQSNTFKISIQFDSNTIIELVCNRNMNDFYEFVIKKNELVEMVEDLVQEPVEKKNENKELLQKDLENFTEKLKKSAILIQIFHNSELIYEEIFFDKNYYSTSLTDLLGYRFKPKPHYLDEQKIKQLIETDYKIQINSTLSTIQMYRNLFLKGLKRTLNQFLSERIARFVSLDEIDEELMITMNDHEGNYIIPFQSMGDGFKALLNLYTFLLEKNSIILVDEIERSFHPGYLEIICQEFVKMIGEHQLIFTTHSLEFIQIMLGALKEQNERDSFQIVRMVRDFDGLDRIVLDFDSIIVELENLKVDLRGY